MDKLIKFIDLYWPVEYCNFNCRYCYVHQHRENKGSRYTCSHSPKEIRRALSRERLGGTCLLNICAGGETLIEDGIVPVIYELLEEGHYIGIVTNGTIKHTIDQLLEFPLEFKERLLFKFSFHYEELIRQDKLEEFFQTVQQVKEQGASFSLELPAYDEFIGESEKIRAVSEKYTGYAPHVNVLRDERKFGFPILSKYPKEDLKKIWSDYHSDLFDFRLQIMEEQYRGFCYAGDWAFTVHLETGEIRQCFSERIIDYLYAHLDEKLNLCAVGSHCHAKYCYVCHSFLTLGVIPELNIQYRFRDMRDREGKWLTPKMREFLSQRLFENNHLYSEFETDQVNKRNKDYELSVYEDPDLFLRRTITEMKNYAEKENYVLLEARQKANIVYRELPECLQWLIYPMGGPVDTPKDIFICTDGKQDSMAQGNEIGIVGVLADQIWYDACDLFEDSWIQENRTCRWRSWDNKGISNTIAGSLPKAENIRLVLESNRWRGICRISYQGNEIVENCFQDTDDDVLFVWLRKGDHFHADTQQNHYPDIQLGKNIRGVFENRNLAYYKVDADEKSYFCDQYGLMDYHIDFLNTAMSKIDFRGKKVLEIGGANYPQELVTEKIGAKQWVCVDKPWICNDTAKKNHFDKHKFYRFSDEILADLLKEQSYFILNEYADDIPELFTGQFDICVSNCAMEHIRKLPYVLKKICCSLKVGGELYAQAAPIWSSKNGSHIYINGVLMHHDLPKELEFAHLLDGYAVIHQKLKKLFGTNFADENAYFVKNSDSYVNNLFYEDYEYILQESDFSLKSVLPLYTYTVSEETMTALQERFPGYKNFHFGGVEISAVK